MHFKDKTASKLHELYEILYTPFKYPFMKYYFEFEFFGVNVTFSTISAISWRPVLVAEEAGVP